MKVEGAHGPMEACGRGQVHEIGRRMEGGHVPVFPHTHIGIPNPLSPPCQTFKDSQSSFEDLEEECLEFSTEYPRSC